MSFFEKVVLVTGASAGIGACTAISFAREGANVALVGRNEVKLKGVLEQCEKFSQKCLLIKADISQRENAVRAVRQTVERYGRLDVLVNNAGISKCGGILDENFMDAFDETMNTNLRALAHITNLAAPHLVETKGSIVNISSVTGTSVRHSSNALPYYVSKAAVNHFTRAIALELAQHGVRANTISPGPVRTDFFKNANITEPIEFFGETTALKRVSEAEEIAELVLYLASDKAKCITGSNYICDNGYMLKS